jgi:tetratricopeptide (TPR) repeat protein
MASAQIGILRFLQKDYQAAVLALEPVLRLADTPREDLYGLFARALVAAGRLDEAERVCGEGEKAHPQGVALPVLRAEILLRRGNHDEAKLLFRATVDRANGSEASYAETVEACVRVREFDEGERWASEGLERHPDSFHLRSQAGALQERLGKFREAERRFRELLRDDPDHAETLNYLGYMLADRGIKLEEAAGFLQRAVNLSPNNAAYQDSLGWAYYRLGRLEEAESLLRTAARGSRNDPTIYDHLGDVLSRRGKRDEALEAYRIAIEHEPDNPEEIRKKIRKISPRTSAP